VVCGGIVALVNDYLERRKSLSNIVKSGYLFDEKSTVSQFWKLTKIRQLSSNSAGDILLRKYQIGSGMTYSERAKNSTSDSVKTGRLGD
jgi:hypothetical protein